MSPEDLFPNRPLQIVIEAYKKEIEDQQVANTSPRIQFGAFARGVFTQVKVKVCEVRRQAVMQTFQKGLQEEWGPRQIAKLEYPLPEAKNSIRVVTVRHGFGKHNEGLGIGSVANRDAELVPSIGVPQAYASGRKMAEANLFKPPISNSLLIVISPFRRTLQTALYFMGNDRWIFPTIITPLAGEHTFERSGVMQGDRGSTAAQLREWFPQQRHPQFDFSEVDRYCDEKSISGGAWWHHGEGSHETDSSFQARARELRRFLIQQARVRGAQHVLLVSHGGLLTHAFDNDKYDNCEFRVFDLFDDGYFCHPVDDREADALWTDAASIKQSSSRNPSTDPLVDPFGSVDLLTPSSPLPSPFLSSSPPSSSVSIATSTPMSTSAFTPTPTLTPTPTKPPKPAKAAKAVPMLVIEEVVQEMRKDGGHRYHFKGSVMVYGHRVTIDSRHRLSEIRAGLREKFEVHLPKALCDDLGEFPSRLCPHLMIMRYLEPWVQRIAHVVNSRDITVDSSSAPSSSSSSSTSSQQRSSGGAGGTKDSPRLSGDSPSSVLSGSVFGGSAWLLESGSGPSPTPPSSSPSPSPSPMARRRGSKDSLWTQQHRDTLLQIVVDFFHDPFALPPGGADGVV